MPPAPAHLSSAVYLASRQCPKRAWLDVAGNAPRRGPPSAVALAMAAAAAEVRALARERWPKGIRIEPSDAAIEATRDAMGDMGVPAVFDAVVAGGGVVVRVDALIRGADGEWDALALKATTSVKGSHVDLLALQVHALLAIGYRVGRAGVLFLDNAYVLGAAGLDLDAVFAFVDVLPRITPAVDAIEAELAVAREVLARETCPEVAAGPHCFRPQTCPYVPRCVTPPGRFDIQVLPRSERLVAAMAAIGVHDVRDIPPGTPMSPFQARVVQCLVSGQPYVGPGLGPALAAMTHPLRFLDFECAAFPIPRYPGTSPHETLPTQWSMHLRSSAIELQHGEYLHDRDSDPRRPFLESLLDAAGTSGSVVVYSDYEATQLRRLARAIPERAAAVDALIGRFVDLLAILRAHHYHPDYAGSYSIKTVLPTLVPGLSYRDLVVHDGLAAALLYRRLIETEDVAEAQAAREALLRYCERDSLAMVRIWEALVVAAGG